MDQSMGFWSYIFEVLEKTKMAPQYWRYSETDCDLKACFKVFYLGKFSWEDVCQMEDFPFATPWDMQKAVHTHMDLEAGL